VLIDVSAVAPEAGIRYPVALTAAVWAKCVAVPPGVACQDEAGRLLSVGSTTSSTQGACGFAGSYAVLSHSSAGHLPGPPRWEPT
jgi:hypothetical protein